MAASIGSVFLGDRHQRARVLSGGSSASAGSTSTPPSTPPAHLHQFHHSTASLSQLGTPESGMSSILNEISRSTSPTPSSTRQPSTISSSLESAQPPPNQGENVKPVAVDPILALELRIRWLETLLLGVAKDGAGALSGKAGTGSTTQSLSGPKGARAYLLQVKSKKRDSVAPANRALTNEDGTSARVAELGLKSGDTLTRLTEEVQKKVDAAVTSNEGLKKFMDRYDQHANLLTAAFALSGILPDPPTYQHLSSEELDALLVEMEPDIRAADRDIREIEALERKGITGAGKLADYQTLQPRLDALIKTHQENAQIAASLEQRIAHIMKRHATQVDTLSELFVEWDDTITDSEDSVKRLEKEKEQRVRLGLEI